MISTHLGKITAARFGMGGYQDVMIGLTLTFEGEFGGIGEFNGTWAMAPGSGAQWTLEDQSQKFAECVRRLAGILKDSKRNSVETLVGVPVEVRLVSGTLHSWRVLKEVL